MNDSKKTGSGALRSKILTFPVLPALMGICSLIGILCIIFYGPYVTFDTESYLLEGQNILNGMMPVERTPVYPLFLILCSLIGGESGFAYVAVIIQWMVYIAVMPLAWRTLRMLGCDRLIAAVVMLAGFVLCGEIWIFNNATNPESLSVSALLFLCWALLNLYHRPDIRMAVYTIAAIVFLIFLRPSFIYILPVGAVFFLFRLADRPHRGIWLTSLSLLLVTGAGYCWYCYGVYRQMGVFTPTGVSVLNSWESARAAGTVDTAFIADDGSGKELKELMAENGEQFSIPMTKEEMYIAAHEMQRYTESHGPLGYKEIDRIINQSHGAHPGRYVRAIMRRTAASFTEPFGFMNLPSAYEFLFLMFPLLLWQWHRTRRFPWYISLLWALALSHLAIPLINAMNSWDRLAFPAWPLFCIMFGSLLSHLHFRKGGAERAE